MISKNYIKIISCPNCKGNLREIEIDHHLLGFFCEKCKLIYPIKEGIIVLLPKNARDYNLEYDLIQNIKKKLLNHSIKKLEQYIHDTLKLLDSSKNFKSWEWEDEEYWGKEYKKEAKTIVQKNWNDRIWQREFLIKNLLNKTKLNGKTILDVGCGEGQNFRLLLSKHCDETSVYIATDISFEGLKLNRLRNTHKNSIYILCSADRLPFHKETINILCYFGILHHTERKVATISQDSDLVKKGGYILIHEVLDRKSFSSFLPGFLKLRGEQSAHEESINKKELLSQISNMNLKIIVSRESYTIFFGIMMRLFRNIMINNKVFFHFISTLDFFLMRLFKNIIFFFRAGEIMLLVRKSQKKNKGTWIILC